MQGFNLEKLLDFICRLVVIFEILTILNNLKFNDNTRLTTEDVH
jgi:hypothetical protein